MPAPQEQTPQSNRPRARLDRRGARCLSDAEILAVLLDTDASQKIPPVEAARALLDRTDGSLYRLSRWTISDFTAAGLSWKRACNLVAAFELSRRFEDRREIANTIKTAQDIFEFFEKRTLPLDRECCWVICLDIKLRVLRYDEITAGTGSASLFHPRDFLRPAVRSNAERIILIHNHPSGDSTPSSSDLKITKQLAAAAKTLDIGLLDHVIIGRRNIPPHTKGFFSFADAGLLE